jgi:nitrite reductase/ring-hydroxylating ferredoxin subunit
MNTLLCRIDELPDGGARGFDPGRSGQDTLLLVRQGERVFAYADACPHHGTPMAWRKDAYLNAARDRIVCHAHGAQFDIATGECLLGPCLGQSLTPVPLHIQASGELHLAPGTHEETLP